MGSLSLTYVRHVVLLFLKLKSILPLWAMFWFFGFRCISLLGNGYARVGKSLNCVIPNIARWRKMYSGYLIAFKIKFYCFIHLYMYMYTVYLYMQSRYVINSIKYSTLGCQKSGISIHNIHINILHYTIIFNTKYNCSLL